MNILYKVAMTFTIGVLGMIGFAIGVGSLTWSYKIFKKAREDKKE